MKRFIEGEDRSQSTLFPERLDDYIAEDNAIRVVDAFVDGLDLQLLGFERAEPSATGRPGYHPSVLLKIYIYGYLNRIQTSRRLERESQRNVELIWLTRRLMPDFKTIADFRKDNRKAIRGVCREFVELCREYDLYSRTLVAIDGSKFKAVNSRDKNFTRKSVARRIKKTEANIERYLAKLDAADQEEPEIREITTKELNEKIASMQEKLAELNERAREVEASPDKQVSVTDPDARSMMKPGGGSVVGYNVQTAVDSKHHLIPYHEVTSETSDRGQLAGVAGKAKAASRGEDDDNTQAFTVVADPGYYKGEEIAACYRGGIRALVPRRDTSGKRDRGEFPRSEFIYDADKDEYVCPAGERAVYRFTSKEAGKEIRRYWSSACPRCALKPKCTRGKNRRISRSADEPWLEQAQADLKQNPDAMRARKKLVEHPYGTIKHWMGSTHFLMKRLPNVRAEMSLHVLAWNMKRAISVLGVPAILEKLESA
jgi:transposase